jgi:hypothetical protein
MQNEVWKPVVGYENRYEVSNGGGIKRVCGGKGVKRPIISPRIGELGSRVVKLSDGNIAIRKRLDVHRLVVQTFRGGRTQPRPPSLRTTS